MSSGRGRSGGSDDEDAPSQKRGRPNIVSPVYFSSPSTSNGGSTSPIAVHQPFSFHGQFGSGSETVGSFPSPTSVQVPDLASQWGRAGTADREVGLDSPHPIESHGFKSSRVGGGNGGRRSSYSGMDDMVDVDYENGGALHQTGKDKGELSCMWIRLLPVKYGWPKLLLYALLGSVFLFLAAQYVLNASGRTRRSSMHGIKQFDNEDAPYDAAAELESVRSELKSRGDMGEVLEKLDHVVNHALRKAGEQSPKQATHQGEEPAPASTLELTPPVVARVIPPPTPVEPTPSPAPTPAAPVVQPPTPPKLPAIELTAFTQPNVDRVSQPPHLPTPQPIPNYGRKSPAEPAPYVIPGAPVAPSPVATSTDPSHAGGHLGHAPSDHVGVLPGDAGALPEGGVGILAERVREQRRKEKEEKEKQEKENAKQGAKAKDGKGDKKKAEEKKKKEAAAGAKEKDKKQGGKSAPAKIPAYTDSELSALRAASAAVRSSKASTGSFPLPAPTPAGGKFFSDEVIFVIATKSNKHEALAKAMKTWGSVVSKVLIFSNAADTAHGLSTIVLPPIPHSEWKPINTGYHSWRVGQIFRYLRENAAATGEKSTAGQFYIWLDDVTFPILDSIKTKLDGYRASHGGAYPVYAGGPLQPTNFYKSYWAEQQSQAYKLFKSAPLQASAGWLFGFSPSFLDLLGEFVHPDLCPVLFGDDLAVAGMVKCAGGRLEDPQLWQVDFFSLSKLSPPEVDAVASKAPQDWRKKDAYHGFAATKQIEQAWQAYYEKAGLATKA